MGFKNTAVFIVAIISLVYVSVFTFRLINLFGFFLLEKWVIFLFFLFIFFSVSVKVLPVAPLLSCVFVHRVFCTYFVRFEGLG